MEQFDFAAIARAQDKETDRKRAKAKHGVNKEIRKKEIYETNRRVEKYVNKSRRDRERRRNKLRPVVLAPVITVPPVEEPPKELATYSVIPAVVAQPTAFLPGGGGSPWSVMGSTNTTQIADIIGSIIIEMGGKVVAVIAAKAAVKADRMSQSWYSILDRRFKVRSRTGRSGGTTVAEGLTETFRQSLQNLPGGGIQLEPNPELEGDWWKFWDWTW